MSTTEKFDLDLTDYGLTGWNGILKGSIEAIDSFMQERIIGSLATAVGKGEVLYWNSTSALYDQAKAAAGLLPAIGLALEAGSPSTASFDLRILRVGLISLPGWSLATGAEIWLAPGTLGDITVTKPAAFAQRIGYATATTQVYVDIKPPEWIHYGTADAPTPTGYPDGIIYCKYTA